MCNDKRKQEESEWYHLIWIGGLVTIMLIWTMYVSKSYFNQDPDLLIRFFLIKGPLAIASAYVLLVALALLDRIIAGYVTGLIAEHADAASKLFAAYIIGVALIVTFA